LDLTRGIQAMAWKVAQGPWKAYIIVVTKQIEPMQQPVRKVVGRTADASKRLAQVEDPARFVKKHARGALTRAGGEYFPIRKSVGQPRRQRR
jgi:hypothetical protein